MTTLSLYTPKQKSSARFISIAIENSVSNFRHVINSITTNLLYALVLVLGVLQFQVADSAEIVNSLLQWNSTVVSTYNASR